ncbi:hypothetical protein CC1G_05836 [Coprinopsis cinerea okayama7|uniref:Uncharacterized protein n=1 Tax=Coprinopsis cinerea (strain Okayama-7 / 130 / ATCC MYA-4618 / FGSC 9003) TaxID=240176 RepID=A8NLJ0_COPC7|nr:hypothetical protein CC1G_05836 [Coprinopsis cinerea okayama7\|eukprot:XP_001834699.2 hypothetical protein CC1G_05836 [Coprinopsis cinerea okayama7\
MSTAVPHPPGVGDSFHRAANRTSCHPQSDDSMTVLLYHESGNYYTRNHSDEHTRCLQQLSDFQGPAIKKNFSTPILVNDQLARGLPLDDFAQAVTLTFKFLTKASMDIDRSSKTVHYRQLNHLRSAYPSSIDGTRNICNVQNAKNPHLVLIPHTSKENERSSRVVNSPLSTGMTDREQRGVRWVPPSRGAASSGDVRDITVIRAYWRDCLRRLGQTVVNSARP